MARNLNRMLLNKSRGELRNELHSSFEFGLSHILQRMDSRQDQTARESVRIGEMNVGVESVSEHDGSGRVDMVFLRQKVGHRLTGLPKNGWNSPGDYADSSSDISSSRDDKLGSRTREGIVLVGDKEVNIGTTQVVGSLHQFRVAEVRVVTTDDGSGIVLERDTVKNVLFSIVCHVIGTDSDALKSWFEEFETGCLIAKTTLVFTHYFTQVLAQTLYLFDEKNVVSAVTRSQKNG